MKPIDAPVDQADRDRLDGDGAAAGLDEVSWFRHDQICLEVTLADLRPN